MARRWRLRVEHLMACNCAWGCPCSFDSPPTYGKCETALAYRVADEAYGGISLRGLKFVLVATWPKAIHLGHGRGVVYLDARAVGSRRDALEAVATASGGGPMKVYMSTMTKPPPIHVERIEFEFRGKRSWFRAGPHALVKFGPMVNPVTRKEHRVITLLPTGLFTKREESFSATAFRVNADGIRFSYPGRNANLSVSKWHGP